MSASDYRDCLPRDESDINCGDFSVSFDGLAFPECPRWRDGSLYFSDMYLGTIWKGDFEQGRFVGEAIWTSNSLVGGLGWLGNDLLIVDMLERSIGRLHGDTLVRFVDLSAQEESPLNDMIFLEEYGFGFVGAMGFNLLNGEPFAPGRIWRFDSTGATEVVFRSLDFPNGMALSMESQGLLVAETFSHRIARCPLNIEDGVRRSPETYGYLAEGERPDGMCMDEKGDVWVASTSSNEVIAIGSDGVVTARLNTGTLGAFACAISRDGLLVVCASAHRSVVEARRNRSGCLLIRQLDVGGAPEAVGGR